MPGWNWQKVKQMLSNNLRLNFSNLKITHILDPMLSKNNKTYSKKLKNKQKNGLKDQVCLYSWGNENEDENEK